MPKITPSDSGETGKNISEEHIGRQVSDSESSSSSSSSSSDDEDKKSIATDGGNSDAPGGRTPSPERKKDSDEKKPSQLPPDNIVKIAKAGSAYVPPAKAKAMMDKMSDKGSIQYQRMAWEALKKSINGLVNKVNLKVKKNKK